MHVEFEELMLEISEQIDRAVVLTALEKHFQPAAIGPKCKNGKRAIRRA
jgi:hypothetical protein